MRTVKLRDNYIIYFRQLDTHKEYSTGVQFYEVDAAIRYCVTMNRAMAGTKREYFYLSSPVPDNRPVRISSCNTKA